MRLSESNMKIIRLMGEGATDKEIAYHLKMPVPTINKRIRRMLQKWDCKNRTQLVLKVVLFNIESFAGKV